MNTRERINHNRLKELFKLIDNYFEATDKPLIKSKYKQFESIAEMVSIK